MQVPRKCCKDMLAELALRGSQQCLLIEQYSVVCARLDATHAWFMTSTHVQLSLHGRVELCAHVH